MGQNESKIDQPCSTSLRRSSTLRKSTYVSGGVGGVYLHAWYQVQDVDGRRKRHRRKKRTPKTDEGNDAGQKLVADDFEQPSYGAILKQTDQNQKWSSTGTDAVDCSTFGSSFVGEAGLSLRQTSTASVPLADEDVSVIFRGCEVENLKEWTVISSEYHQKKSSIVVKSCFSNTPSFGNEAEDSQTRVESESLEASNPIVDSEADPSDESSFLLISVSPPMDQTSEALEPPAVSGTGPGYGHDPSSLEGSVGELREKSLDASQRDVVDSEPAVSTSSHAVLSEGMFDLRKEDRSSVDNLQTTVDTLKAGEIFQVHGDRANHPLSGMDRDLETSNLLVICTADPNDEPDSSLSNESVVTEEYVNESSRAGSEESYSVTSFPVMDHNLEILEQTSTSGIDPRGISDPSLLSVSVGERSEDSLDVSQIGGVKVIGRTGSNEPIPVVIYDDTFVPPTEELPEEPLDASPKYTKITSFALLGKTDGNESNPSVTCETSSCPEPELDGLHRREDTNSLSCDGSSTENGNFVVNSSSSSPSDEAPFVSELLSNQASDLIEHNGNFDGNEPDHLPELALEPVLVIYDSSDCHTFEHVFCASSPRQTIASLSLEDSAEGAQVVDSSSTDIEKHVCMSEQRRLSLKDNDIDDKAPKDPEHCSEYIMQPKCLFPTCTDEEAISTTVKKIKDNVNVTSESFEKTRNGEIVTGRRTDDLTVVNEDHLARKVSNECHRTLGSSKQFSDEGTLSTCESNNDVVCQLIDRIVEQSEETCAENPDRVSGLLQSTENDGVCPDPKMESKIFIIQHSSGEEDVSAILDALDNEELANKSSLDNIETAAHISMHEDGLPKDVGPNMTDDIDETEAEEIEVVSAILNALEAEDLDGDVDSLKYSVDDRKLSMCSYLSCSEYVDCPNISDCNSSDSDEYMSCYSGFNSAPRTSLQSDSDWLPGKGHKCRKRGTSVPNLIQIDSTGISRAGSQSATSLNDRDALTPLEGDQHVEVKKNCLQLVQSSGTDQQYTQRESEKSTSGQTSGSNHSLDVHGIANNDVVETQVCGANTADQFCSHEQCCSVMSEEGASKPKSIGLSTLVSKINDDLHPICQAFSDFSLELPSAGDSVEQEANPRLDVIANEIPEHTAKDYFEASAGSLEDDILSTPCDLVWDHSSDLFTRQFSSSLPDIVYSSQASSHAFHFPDWGFSSEDSSDDNEFVSSTEEQLDDDDDLSPAILLPQIHVQILKKSILVFPPDVEHRCARSPTAVISDQQTVITFQNDYFEPLLSRDII